MAAIVLLLGPVSGALGQVADSVLVPPAEAIAPADSVALIPSFSDSALVRLPAALIQAPKSRTARLPYLDLPALLAETPGSWVHDFGTPGWPDGWSPYGADPGSVRLTLDDLPFDDPVTGRPDYELLPFDKLGSISLGTLLGGRPEGIAATASSFRSARPLTEIVYRSTTTGLQQVSVSHAQTRMGIGNAPIQYLFAYGGAGSRGEYDGSRLQRKRQILLRLRRETSALRVELGEMFNRHRVGAQGGVQPFAGFEYASVYQRLGATVENPSAVRQSSRNDLWIRAEIPGRGTWAKAWWTVGTLTHRLNLDTTVARVSRLGLKLGQPLFGQDLLNASISAFKDSYPERNGWTESPSSRMEASAMLSGLYEIGQAKITWSAGVTAIGTGIASTEVEPGYTTHASWNGGFARPFLRSRRGLRAHSASDIFGFGGTVVPSATAQTGRQSLDEFGVSMGTGTIQVTASIFASQSTNGLVRTLDGGADTLSVVPYSGTSTRLGGTGRIGLRDTSRRGAYAWLQGTVFSTTGDDPTLDERLTQVVPEVSGIASVGIRGLLFQDDLDGDLSLRIRGWSSHRGLRLHAPTGLLALPDPEARPIAESFVLDLVAIAHVRTATLTVSMENLLSGTTLVPGNQLVADYPYPARRLRFSVFWPIMD